jgi:hypothetical protein
MKFEDLIDSLDGKMPSYSDLLSTEEWEEKRNGILKRDRFYCSICGLSKSFFLNEYNQYYNFSKKEILEFELEGKIITADKVVVDKESRHLHVHHKYYVLQTLPWKYDDKALITLCNWCHWELHKNEIIPIYSKLEQKLLNITPCKRCNGAGSFPQYNHVQNGICFECNGAKYEELIGKPHELWIDS